MNKLSNKLLYRPGVIQGTSEETTAWHWKSRSWL